MTDETPQPEGEPSPAAPEEAPTAETKPFTYDDAIASGADRRRGRRRARAEAPTQAAPVAAPVAAAAPGAPVAAGTRDVRPARRASSSRSGSASSPPRSSPRSIFGGIGYAIGDSSDSGSTQNASNVFPNGNANGGQQLPGGGQFPGGGSSRTADSCQRQRERERQRQRQRQRWRHDRQQRRLPRRRRADQHRPQGRRDHRRGRRQPRGQGGLQQGDVITAIDGNDVTSDRRGALGGPGQAERRRDQRHLHPQRSVEHRQGDAHQPFAGAVQLTTELPDVGAVSRRAPG